MRAFLEHEAKEVVEDIEAKTEGDFFSLKGQLIQEGRIRLNKLYDKKEKQAIRQLVM